MKTGRKYSRVNVSAGHKVNRLTFVREVASKPGRRACLVRCDCGTEKELSLYNFYYGGTKSCGCAFSDYMEAGTVKTHGLHLSPTYQSWAAMKRRCQSPHASNYSKYGGRGITVCEQWQTFEGFYADMGDRPPGTSLDRIDVGGNYEPSNCRWATPREQGNNRETCRYIEFQGERKTMQEWARQIGISWPALARRLATGWPIEEALTTGRLPPSESRLHARRRAAAQAASDLSREGGQ